MTEKNDKDFVECLLKNIVCAYNYKKVCIPAGCVPPTSVAILGGVWQTLPLGRHHPWAHTPWADTLPHSPGQIPHWADTPGLTPPGQIPPLGRHPLGQPPAPPPNCMLGYTPLPIACWDKPPWIQGMTHACENITFWQLL